LFVKEIVLQFAQFQVEVGNGGVLVPEKTAKVKKEALGLTW